MSFPELAQVLDFPELRNLFARYEAPSNRAKMRRRWAGLTAIVLGVLAILGASAHPLYGGIPERWLAVLGGVFAALGILSVLIGAFGVLAAASKQEWLCGRLMTERLRQFQFQMLVCHAPTIVASVSDPVAAARFLEFRRKRLFAFQVDHEGHLAGKLNDVLSDNAEEDFWLHESEGAPESEKLDFKELFSAYRLLRFQHQIQYGNYKLREEGLGSSLRQVALLTQISLLCILIVFVLHFLIALSLLTPVKEWFAFAEAPSVHVLVVWTAIAALAARALEEGLQPTREVERYTRYRSVLARLLFRFDHASEPAEKIKVMKETERAVYQEMRAFLKTNYEARFVI